MKNQENVPFSYEKRLSAKDQSWDATLNLKNKDFKTAICNYTQGCKSKYVNKNEQCG